MIEISDWASFPVKDIHLDTYPNKYSVGFTLKDNCDARTDWSRKFIEKVCGEIINIEYIANDAQLKVNNIDYSIRDLDKLDLPDGEVLVDATSLPLPELLHIFTLLNSKKRNFDVVYIQPTTYKEQDSKALESNTIYELSDDGLGVQQLPPFVGSSRNSRILFFLGWEGHRLGALINSDEFNVKNMTCLAGIPGYQVGWDNITLSCNFMQFKELNTFASPRFKFSGANDPLKTYTIIKGVYDAAKYENYSLSVAAFGTKPSAIAAAQFAVNITEIQEDKSKDLIMLYDFAKIKIDRSYGTSIMHIWSFSYFSNKTA
ncbi:MAG: hypothetical protein CTY35_02935 [Methylotenera sp.]|nr:MAG: hypothetical protein CTY35_02935 [Methylotenera sp.]